MCVNVIWHHGCAGGGRGTGFAPATDGARSKGLHFFHTSIGLTSLDLEVGAHCCFLAGGGDGGSGLESWRNPLPVLASMTATPTWRCFHLGGDSRYSSFSAPYPVAIRGENPNLVGRRGATGIVSSLEALLWGRWGCVDVDVCCGWRCCDPLLLLLGWRQRASSSCLHTMGKWLIAAMSLLTKKER
jgi:hypothetical protein